MKPSSVNKALPAETCVDAPSDVRIKPYTSQGWRPSSAVTHPAVLAMKGNGKLNIRIQSIQADRSRALRHSRNAATTMIAMKIVPSPTMMW